MPLLNPMDLTHLITAPYTSLAIIGLGYVGLPLAVEFGKHRLRTPSATSTSP